MLGDIAGASVLDLFAGTGALGMEALSRGAAEAVLVDAQTKVAKRNVQALGIEDRVAVVKSDALSYLQRESRAFDLILCDPPYRLADRLAPDLDKLLPPRLATHGRLVMESAARDSVELTLPVLTERRYGDTLIRIHSGKGDA
jgi:16S rRNA (guanine(966)-N(2))-methyltransferase RsmD